MHQTSRYKTLIADEETKLRWLITRHPSSLELRYYLLFLLVANERYAKAVKECERILERHTDDLIAQVWMAALRRLRALAHIHYLVRPRHKRRGDRIWGHVCHHSD